MFEYMRFQRQIRKIHRNQKREAKIIIQEAQSGVERRSRYHELRAKTDAEIDYWHTQYLFRELDRLRLPRPKFTDETWTGGPPLGNVEWLTKSAILKVRDEIRKERKERSDIARSWLAAVAPLLSALTGLVGALIGLLAYLAK